MMAELQIPATADVGPLEATVDQTAAHLFYGRHQAARAVLAAAAGQYPCVNRLIDSIPST